MKVIHDMDKAIAVMRNAARWMEESGKNPSKWWQLKNLNPTFLLKHAKENEFYVGLIDGVPAVAAVLMIVENNKDWESVDKGNPQKALYIHWLCVDRRFAGRNLSKLMVDFAQRLAKQNALYKLRLDMNADNQKLRKIYERLQFQLVGAKQEDYRQTAYYERIVG